MVWGLSASLWLVLSWKQGRQLGKLSVIGQSLATWGRPLQKLLLVSWVARRDEWLASWAGC